MRCGYSAVRDGRDGSGTGQQAQHAKLHVIPAKAGIQGLAEGRGEGDLYAAIENLVVQGRLAIHWIPACAGMTVIMRAAGLA